MLTGDIATAKAILRDYINATLGFNQLAEATHIPSKSLMCTQGLRQPTGRQSFYHSQFSPTPRGVRFQVKAASTITGEPRSARTPKVR